MSSGNYSQTGSPSASRTYPTRGGSSLGGSGKYSTGSSVQNNEIENLAKSMKQARISTGGSGSGGRNAQCNRNSTSSSRSGNNAIVPKGMKPVAKKDMPYMSQTFVERSLPMIESTGLGTKTIVEANFFHVNFKQEVKVFQYDIQYKNRKGMEMRKAEFTNQAFWYAYRQTKDDAQRSVIFPDRHCLAYNGVNILWSTQKLNFNEAELQIVFGCDDGKEYAMYIKYATMVSVKPRPVGPTEQADTIQILDEVLTARISCLYENISHSFHKQGKAIFYVPTNPNFRGPYVTLGAGLEAWGGLHGAIKPNLQAGLLLNVDLTHSVFYRQRCRLVDFYLEVITNEPYNQNNLHQLQRDGMSFHQRRRLETILKGRALEYKMPNGKNKVFKFSSVADKAASAHTFRMSDTDKTVSIADYYRLPTTYNYRLQCPFLPCICINKAKNLWAPMEFIYTDTVAHKLKGKIPERQLRTMVRDTAYHPHDRKNILMNMAAAGDGNASQPMYLAEQDDYMKNFGLSVDRNMIKVNATLLPIPTLTFGQGEDKRQVTDVDHVGMWELQDGKTLKKINNRQLTVIPAVIFLTPNGTNTDLNLGPFECLMEVLHNFGVTLPGASSAWFTQRYDCYSKNWEVMLEWMRLFKAQVRARDANALPLVLFVFPYKCTSRRQNMDDRQAYFSEYSMVKYICDVFTGIHCQGILSQTYTSMKGNPLTNSTAHNVALKILGKIGATLYKLDTNQEFTAWKKMVNPEEPVLILGVDVTHPGEQDRREGKYAANSVACVIGNVDTACMQYEASVRAQNVGEERILSIKDEVVKRLLAYEKNTGKKPAHIVVYRDGVSETQFQETLYEEKRAIQEACKEISPDYTPTLTYIVIIKRHHTRFFPLRKEDTSGKAFNLKPGTLVESGCTTTNYHDFYLISHNGSLGTSRPAHYYILWDEWAPAASFWQQITFALTYSYVRCPKSISQPAPVMYAHLAAKRAKDYLMAHVHMYGSQLQQMSEYESFTHLLRHMQTHEDLKGMVFV